MNKPFHRILSFVFVTALLFAMAGRTVHVLFEHEHENICSESVTHFHETEHACFICEFDFQVSDSFFSIQPVLKTVSFEKEITFKPYKGSLSSVIVYFTSRGPPTA